MATFEVGFGKDRQFTIGTDEIKDYVIDWTKELDTDEIIDDSSWEISIVRGSGSVPTLSNKSVSDKQTRVFVETPEVDLILKLTNIIETSEAPRTYEHSIYLRTVDK